MMNKVAKVDFSFWVMKICATTLGETGGDLLSMTLKVGYAMGSTILLIIFVVAFIAQLASKKFNPALYWTVILATSSAGTEISDFMDRTLKLGYPHGSLILLSGLLIVLTIWYLSEKSLSVDNIQTTKVEIFYWVAILFSNTLGTALGDFLSLSSGLGFMDSAASIGSLIGLAVLAFYFTKVNRVALFWVAFVLTRPFGATFGDFLTKPIQKGGLNFGTVGASVFLALVLVSMVIYKIIKDKCAQAPKNNENNDI